MVAQALSEQIEQGKDGAINLGQVADARSFQFCLITLMRDQGQPVAVSAVICRCATVDSATDQLRVLKFVAEHFELYTRRKL